MCARCGHEPSWHCVSRHQPNPCIKEGCDCPDYVVPPKSFPRWVILRSNTMSEQYQIIVAQEDDEYWHSRSGALFPKAHFRIVT